VRCSRLIWQSCGRTPNNSRAEADCYETFPSGTAKTKQNSTARQGHHKTTTQISYVRRLSQKQKLLELPQNMSQRSVRLKILCAFVFFHNQTNLKEPGAPHLRAFCE
jgi:hypothetical protein